MTTHRFAQFELDSWPELAKTALGATSLIGVGEPILSGLAKTIPRAALQRVVRAWSTAAIRFLDLTIEVTGTEHIDPSKGYVVAPLHEGFADVLALSRLPLELRYVARDELSNWRWLGRFLRASDQILVKADQALADSRMLVRECERTLTRGQSIVVFPQGSILGIETAFTSEAFRIADLFERHLLPVVLTGTHRVWEHPYTDRLRYGQTVSTVVLPPIPIGDALSSMRETERKMKQLALSPSTAPPRRFDPRRDGYWDGYRYEIDADFPELAALVEAHRRH